MPQVYAWMLPPSFLAIDDYLSASSSRWIASKQLLENSSPVNQLALEQLRISKPGPSACVQEIKQEVRSPFQFALNELNDVLKGGINGDGVSHQAVTGHLLANTFIQLNRHSGDSYPILGNVDVASRSNEFITWQSATVDSDALYSLMSTSGTKSKVVQDNPTTDWAQTLYGGILIDCTTTPASGGNPEGILGSEAKIEPGWFSNVNWSADWDSGNGWNPGTTKTTTANPNATYTPDTEIPVVSGGIAGGDPDLRKFVVKVAAHTNTGNHNWDFKLTFPSAVRIYKDTNTKAESPIESGTVFTPTGGNHITKTMTFYLEGITASSAFCDVPLKAQYVGGNIPMLSTIDTVNVTVFGISATGKYGPGPKSADNEFSFINPDGAGINDPDRMPPVSNNQLGKLSYTDDPLCHHFHNCMEMQGTLLPPVVEGITQPYGLNAPPPPVGQQSPYVTFGAYRESFAVEREFKRTTNAWEIPASFSPIKWKNDTTPYGFDLTPSLQSHIYYSDAPGKVGETTATYLQWQQTANFRNWFTVKFYGGEWMASPFALWHSQVVLITDPNNQNVLKRDVATKQLLADGWISVSTNPV